MTFSLKYQFVMTSRKKTNIHDFPGWFQIPGFSMTVGTLRRGNADDQLEVDNTQMVEKGQGQPLRAD